MKIEECKLQAKVGRSATISDVMYNRGGETGTITEVFDDGVAILFEGSTEEEHWKWSEIRAIGLL